jgi:hypothetical protein
LLAVPVVGFGIWALYAGVEDATGESFDIAVPPERSAVPRAHF